jgi:ankyrin repeat protein
LYIASQQGQVEVVKELIRAGANIEAVFKTGFTPLYVAARLNDLFIFNNEKDNE